MDKIINSLKITAIFMAISCCTITLSVAQNVDDTVKEPKYTPADTDHDFGEIGENDGNATHIFKFTNTGTAPLVVTQVTTSCGCTRPEWTKTPVEPGQEGEIIISYSPKGRIGIFQKSATVFTNEDGGFKRHRLGIKGMVIDKPKDPNVAYADTTGGVGIETKRLLFNTFAVNETNRKAVYIKNFNPQAAYISFEDTPEFMTVSAPDSLKPNWPGELAVTIDGSKTAERRGRISDVITLTVKDRDGVVLGKDKIVATANYLDDFSGLSPLQRVSAPSLDIKNSVVELGEVKSGFLFFGGSAGKQIVLTNKGKNDMILRSVTCDDPRVHIPELAGKVIKAGASLPVNVQVKAKEMGNTDVDTDIYIVCNDPHAPVRLVKVTAQKSH